MIGEFENIIAKKLNDGQALTGEDLSQIYLSLVVKYFGNTGIEFSKTTKYQWLTHSTLFYGSHYVSWALAKIASENLSERLARSDKVAIDTIVNGIRNSKTHLSYEVLSSAGISFEKNNTFEPIKKRIRDLSKALIK